MKKFLLLFSLLSSSFLLQAQQPGDIIITEIMQNPDAVADGAGEWFEVYNKTNAPIDINGWVIKDDGTDNHTIDNGGPLNVASKGYLVIGRDIDPMTNGGVAVHYEMASIFLANGDDELILEANGTVIDHVAYDNGVDYPDPTGASMNLDILRYGRLLNDVGGNWCISTDVFGSGDLGTPGQANISCGQPPLPVTLVDFAAVAENQSVRLKWSTASESNSDYFALEHSTDGRDFTEIHHQNGAGTSENLLNYFYDHDSPSASHNNYYRLRMVDFDGSFELSPVVVVRLKAVYSLALAPNPARDIINISQQSNLRDADFYVFNALGQQVLNGRLEGDAITTLDISALEPGTYFLRTVNGRSGNVLSFVKL